MNEPIQDDEMIEAIDPAFDREAAMVMNSPYWVDNLIERNRERDIFVQAVRNANSYADLKGEAKAIYDRAKEATIPPTPWGN